MVVQETRTDFAIRVVEVLEVVFGKDTDADIREGMLTRIADSVDACNDKPTWALNQMTLVKMIVKARGNRMKIKDLGRRVMNLDVVHRHAKQKCDSLQFVDDVCVYLKFEIDLLKDLDLPVSAKSMHFPSYIKISDQEIDATRQEALGVSEEQFLVWLEAWPEWQREERLEVAKKITLDKIPKCIENTKRLSWRKSLRNLLGERNKDTVVLNGQRWSLADLLRHWVETGRNLNNNSLTCEEISNNLTRI
jgi:hypothetical protein